MSVRVDVYDQPERQSVSGQGIAGFVSRGQSSGRYTFLTFEVHDRTAHVTRRDIDGEWPIGHDEDISPIVEDLESPEVSNDPANQPTQQDDLTDDSSSDSSSSSESSSDSSSDSNSTIAHVGIGSRFRNNSIKRDYCVLQRCLRNLKHRFNGARKKSKRWLFRTKKFESSSNQGDRSRDPRPDIDRS